MEQSNNLVRENLIFLLQNMDIDLVQRISDFTHGVLSIPQNKEQKEYEFPPLTQDEIEGVKEALEQAKNGEVYSEEEIKNRFFK